MWLPQTRDLSGEFHTVAPDLPGHGTRAGKPFRMEPAIDVLEDTLETHVDGSAVLVGLSLGAMPPRSTHIAIPTRSTRWCCRGAA